MQLPELELDLKGVPLSLLPRVYGPKFFVQQTLQRRVATCPYPRNTVVSSLHTCFTVSLRLRRPDLHNDSPQTYVSALNTYLAYFQGHKERIRYFAAVYCLGEYAGNNAYHKQADLDWIETKLLMENMAQYRSPGTGNRLCLLQWYLQRFIRGFESLVLKEGEEAVYENAKDEYKELKTFLTSHMPQVRMLASICPYLPKMKNGKLTAEKNVFAGEPPQPKGRALKRKKPDPGML